MKKALALALTVLASAISTLMADVTYNGSVVNEPLCYTRNIDLDFDDKGVDSAAVQLVYSTASPNTVTFTDGVAATGTITVTTLTGLTTAYATNRITVNTNSALAGAVLTFNNFDFVEGIHWARDVNYSSNTAVALCNALNTYYGATFVSTVTAGSSIIYSTATNYGTAANSWRMYSSTPAALTVLNPTFTGGYDNAIVTINGTAIQVNKDYFAGANTTLTATALAAAINANSTLAPLVTAVGSTNNVNLTAKTAGSAYNYALTTSSAAVLTLTGAVMTGGTNPDLSLTTSKISKSITQWGKGLPVLLGKSAGTYPAPLIDKTTYYATNIIGSTFQLSDTSTGAAAGLGLTFSTMTQAGGGSFTLTPIAITGTPAFKLQSSNDGNSFFDLTLSTTNPLATTAASVSFASPYTAASQIYVIGQAVYRYLRLAYTNGTWGCVNMNEVVNGHRLGR